MATTSRRALLRPFHQASWNEPIILEQTSPGERGFVPPETEREIAEAVGDGVSAIPERAQAQVASRRFPSSRSRRFCVTTCGSRRRRSGTTSTSTWGSAPAR